MSVTIKDIARKVGVSPSTVSRVINGNTAISQETRTKIKEAMEEMDYHPNSLARNLVNGSTDTIGLIMDASDERSFFNTFFDRSVYAIEKVTQEKGYTLLIANDDCTEKLSPQKKLVLEKKVDGLILPSSIVRPGLVSFLQESGLPFVVLGEPECMKNETCWVDVDNEEGGLLAVRHLFGQGYSNIALLVGSRKNVFVKNRISGYQKGMQEAGITVNEEWIRECQTQEDTECAIAEFLHGGLRPDAIVCGDNILAWQAMQALKKEKLRIPEEIGIVTFDNYPIAQYLDPPLTAVDVDTYGIGEQAVYQLLNKMKRTDSANQHTLMATNLLIRRSSERRGGMK